MQAEGEGTEGSRARERVRSRKNSSGSARSTQLRAPMPGSEDLASARERSHRNLVQPPLLLAPALPTRAKQADTGSMKSLEISAHHPIINIGEHAGIKGRKSSNTPNKSGVDRHQHHFSRTSSSHG